MHRLWRLTSLSLVLGLASCLASGVVRAQSGGGVAQGPDEGLVEGESLTSVEARRRALDELAAEAERRRQAGEAVAVVRALNRIGELHRKLNDPDAALAVAGEALDLARQAGDRPLLVDTLVVSAATHLSREDTRTALRLLNEAHALSVRLGYRRGEAQSLTELGATYFQQSELEKAQASHEEALRIWRELQDRRGEARSLYELGTAYMRTGKARQSRAALEEAAAVWRELGNPVQQARARLNLNFLAIRQGQWQQALTLLNEAQLLVSDEEAEPYISGQIATSLGEVYEAYGQLDAALSYFEEALRLYRDRAHDRSAAVDAGRKAGRVQARLGDYLGAVRRIEEGLQLARTIDDQFMVALCHEDLGRVHLTAGLHVPARQEFLEAVARYDQTGNRREWARARTFLGQTEYLQGNLTAASESYHAALRVFQSVEDYTDEAAVCFGLGKLELEQQNLEEAGKYLKRSIALTEQLRENAASKDLRSSFLASVHDRYETYVEWLMQLHAGRPEQRFDIEAFEASELGRARSLIDSLRDYQKELRHAADPALLSEEEALQKEEQRLIDRRAKLQSEGGDPEALERVEAELMQVRARSETVQAQINSSAKFNNLLRPAPLEFADIRRKITNEETSLLEFSLGGRRSYLWVVTADGLTSYELPDKQTVESAAVRLADLLAAPRRGPEREAELRAAVAEVSRLVLGPVAGKLHSPRLIVVPDGVLQYIPFQILHDPLGDGEPLVARHEVINAPSASTLILVREEATGRPTAPKLLAAFGDPVFSSNYSARAPAAKRGAGETSQIYNDRQRGLPGSKEEPLEPTKVPPLFFARRELNELRKLAPPGEALIYTDFDATRDHLRGLDLRQYRVLHFATHGLLNSKQPELSGLVLSLVDRDGRPVSGFVGLADIYNLHAPVDLVVLSACRTALGKDVRGEGLIGLTRGFMYAGASTVVASLWKVDDEATAELMRQFYANMLRGGMTPAAALRAAQNSIRQEPLWSSPYYWAAFTLQGEYRQTIKSAAADAAPAYLKMTIAVALLSLLAGAAWRYRS